VYLDVEGCPAPVVRRASLATLLLLSGCYLSHTPECLFDPDLCEVAATLDGLRWELPCLGSGPPELCFTEPRVSDGTMFPPGGGRYAVTLRFRGRPPPPALIISSLIRMDG